MALSLEGALLVLNCAAWLLTLFAAGVALYDARAYLDTQPTRHVRWWIAAVLVAGLVRLVVPFDWVRVFTGWDLVGRVLPGQPIPKYGAGFVALFRPIFTLTTWHLDQVVAGVNALVGVVTVGGLGVLASAWLQRPRVMPVVAWGLALLPVLVRHHRSEAALVVAFGAWLLGATLWARWLRHGRRGYAWLAVAPLVAAAHTRPALLVVTALTPWALARWVPAVAASSTSPAQGRRLPRGPAVALLWGVLPQILWLVAGALQRGGRGDLPSAWSPWFVVRAPAMVVGLNMALWPHVFPVALTVTGMVAAWRLRRQVSPEASLLKITLTLGLISLLPGMADPVVVSMPRLQAPWLALWASCAMALWVAPARPRRWLIAAWLITALATVPWLYRAENADHEDQLLLDAATALAGQEGTLHWLTYDDSGVDKVSRHHPTWRFRRPYAQLSMQALRRLPADGHARASPPTWVLLGVRCYGQHRMPDDIAPVRFEHMACKQVRARDDLIPVLERSVRNHGDVQFPWWPSQPELKIGLYRLRAAKKLGL